jgi:hypothetical protein
MPSIGRIKQLSVLGGVAAALLAFGASSASAAPYQIRLWACHGPHGEALPTTTAGVATANGGATVTAVGGGCASPGGGLELKLPANPSRLADATQVFHRFPSDTIIEQIDVNRAFTGFGQPAAAGLPTYFFGGGSPANSYEAFDVSKTNITQPEATLTPANNPNYGDQMRVSLKCETVGGCTAGESSVRFSSAAFRVVESVNGAASSDEATAPKIAVGGVRNEMANDPKTGAGVNIEIRATDVGSGLSGAVVQLDDAAPQVQSFITGTNCYDLTPETPTVIDMPLDAACPTVETVTIPLNTTVVPNGAHRLRVGVYDYSGRYTELRDESLSGDQRPVVNINNNPNYGSPTANLDISTGATNTPQGTNNNAGNSGGVAGATSTSCRTPRLSVILAEKPLRISKRVPVLRANKRYRFTGRLTCVINGKRRSAPKRARIDLLNTVRKKTIDKSGTTVAAKGAFQIILAYPSSRTLTFRFTNSDGQRSQVKIKIKVEKKKKKSKR